jgi:WD40 repeat protein
VVDAFPCPNEGELRRLLAASPDDPAVEEMEQHLLQCDACCQKVARLEASDTWMGALSKETITGESEEEAGQAAELIRHLKDLVPVVSAEPTSNHAEQADAQHRPTFQDGYEFLAPPRQRGELGRLGPYRVLRVLGSGGMGIVFEAEDEHLGRQVALKVMKPALAGSTEARQRFLREARAAAAIEHDHIVAVFQVGDDGGLPYLIMPLLKGDSLDERLRRQGAMPIPEVLRIGREIAEGLAAAHRRGLIHRDIKPANIWLEADRGRVKILDFGLARGTSSSLTQPGIIIGTPAYLAPEQGTAQQIDERSDLFSLGCVLYHLCTGKPPFGGPGPIGTLLAVASEHPVSPAQRNPMIPSPVSDLVMRLLAKDPADRPASALAVVEEIRQQERTCLPVAPSGPGTLAAQAGQVQAPAAQSRKRKPAVVAAVAALGAIAASILAFEIIITITSKGGQKTTIRVAEGSTVEIADKGPGAAAVKPDEPSPFDRLRPEDVDPEELKAAGEGGPEKAPAGLVAILGDSRLSDWSGIMEGVGFGPEGTRLVSAGAYDLRLWDPRTGRPLGPPLPGAARYICCFALSPDRLRAVTGGVARAIQVWDLGKRCEVDRLDVGAGVASVAFSPDGKRIAAGCEDRTARVWDPATRKPVQVLRSHAHPVRAVAFSSDGRWLACGTAEGSIDHQWVKARGVQVWNLATGEEAGRLECAGDTGWSLLFSGDGATLVGGGDGVIRFWDTTTGRLLHAVQDAQLGTVTAMALSPDGTRLATGGGDQKATVWDLASRRRIAATPRQSNRILGLAFSPDGATLATAAMGAPLGFWDSATCRPLPGARPSAAPPHCLALSPGGRTLAVGGDDGGIRVWEFSGARFGLRSTLRGHTEAVRHVAWDPDGKRLASCSSDRSVVLWDPFTEAKLRVLHLDREGFNVTFSRDGRQVIAGCRGLISVWDSHSGEKLQDLSCAGGDTKVALRPPDGKLLAYTAANKVEIRDPSGQVVQTLEGPTRALEAIAFSPDGARLAGMDYPTGTVWVWEVATRRVLHKLETGTQAVMKHVIYSPDGRWIAASGCEGVVFVWDAETGARRRRIRFGELGHDTRQVLFSPDSRHLLAANANGTVYVLRLAERGAPDKGPQPTPTK